MAHLGYRVANYVPVPSWRRWWPLAHQEFLSLFRTKWGVAVFGICLIPSLARLVLLMILFGILDFGPQLRDRLSRGRGPAVAMWDPNRIDFYTEPVLAAMPGMVCVLLLTTLVVARAIARDRATNALELYWTRGISPRAYFWAKWVGCFLLVAMVTVVAPLLLWTVAVLLAEDWSLLAATAPALPGMVGGLALGTALLTTVCLQVSAVSRTANGATVLWCVLLIGSQAVGVIVSKVLRQDGLKSTISIWEAFATIVRTCVDSVPRGVSPGIAFATLGVVVVVLAIVVRRRIRLAEAIG